MLYCGKNVKTPGLTRGLLKAGISMWQKSNNHVSLIEELPLRFWVPEADTYLTSSQKVAWLRDEDTSIVLYLNGEIVKHFGTFNDVYGPFTSFSIWRDVSAVLHRFGITPDSKEVELKLLVNIVEKPVTLDKATLTKLKNNPVYAPGLSNIIFEPLIDGHVTDCEGCKLKDKKILTDHVVWTSKEKFDYDRILETMTQYQVKECIWKTQQ